MGRRVFDVLTSAVGLVLVVVLLVAGGLLMWGYSYDHNNVHNQLAEQQISFPPKAAFAHPVPGSEITQAMIPSVSQYAGQQLLTGPQAEAYADHFIAIHLSEMPYGGVYSKISTAARAEPKNTKIAELETTSFQGTTLRGLLLEAYGFSKIGTIMLYGAIASFILALVMLGFVLLGFRHAQRTPIEEELLPLTREREPVLTGAPS
jgi:hypothetical protein